MPAPQVLTLLGQLKDQVECTSRATMESSASMKWEDVDSKWRLKGVAAKAPIKWPPRPGQAPAVAETAAQLEERIRTNKVSHERVVLAAYLGHAGAREALGAKAPEVPTSLVEWVRGLKRGSDEKLRLRALVALAKRALVVFEEANPGDGRARRAVDAADAYAKNPGRAAAALGTGTALAAEEASHAATTERAGAAAMAAVKCGILVAALDAGRTDGIETIADAVVESAIKAVTDEAALRVSVRDEIIGTGPI
jgi:hypothetical protein